MQIELNLNNYISTLLLPRCIRIVIDTVVRGEIICIINTVRIVHLFLFVIVVRRVVGDEWLHTHGQE